MGGKLSTIPEHRAHYVTPAGKKSSDHCSNNYNGVPKSRAPAAPAYAPSHPNHSYNLASTNIVAPSFHTSRPSNAAAAAGGGNVVGGTPLNASNPKEVIVFHSSNKWREYFEASKQSNKLVVICFTATWSGPCKYLAPTIKELAAKYINIDIVKIDVDELYNVSREFGIQAMPTFIFMKKGKEIDKVIGAKKEDLQDKVEKHSKA